MIKFGCVVLYFDLLFFATFSVKVPIFFEILFGLHCMVCNVYVLHCLCCG